MSDDLSGMERKGAAPPHRSPLADKRYRFSVFRDGDAIYLPVNQFCPAGLPTDVSKVN
jgi:hypothetical protein